MNWLVVIALCFGCRHERVVNPLTPLPTEKTSAAPDRDVSNGPAPAGVVHARDGHEVDLASLWDKQRVVVVFYMGHWCPHCQKQLGDLNEHAREFDAAGAKIIAISTDSTDDQTALHDKLGLSFELYSDPELTVIQKWGVADFSAGIARPATFIVQPGGTISYRHVGQSQTDRPTTAEILQVLQNQS